MIDEINSWPNILGIIGVLIILLAYFLLQIKKWLAESLLYLSTNLIGSLLIAFSLLSNWNLPAFILELLWALISAIAITKCLLKNRLVKKTISRN